jgi:DNA-binding MarR family transcriptional regulator
MFFAYRGFTSDPDRLLKDRDYGRAHHRAIHFINRRPGLTVNMLMTILGVTKQSLNRVLRQLIKDDLVDSRVGTEDRRERNLHLTPAGEELVRELTAAQQERMRQAYLKSGMEAVQGFRTVLDNMIDAETRKSLNAARTQ